MITTTWNGPVCPTCGLHYLGHHSCSWEDLERRINELRDLQKRRTRSLGWIGMDDGGAA